MRIVEAAVAVAACGSCGWCVCTSHPIMTGKCASVEMCCCVVPDTAFDSTGCLGQGLAGVAEWPGAPAWAHHWQEVIEALTGLLNCLCAFLYICYHQQWGVARSARCCERVPTAQGASGVHTHNGHLSFWEHHAHACLVRAPCGGCPCMHACMLRGSGALCGMLCLLPWAPCTAA